MKRLSRKGHLEKMRLLHTPLISGMKSGLPASDGLPFIPPCSSAVDCWELSLVSQAKSALQCLWEEQDCVSDVGPRDPVPAACSLSRLALPLL